MKSKRPRAKRAEISHGKPRPADGKPSRRGAKKTPPSLPKAEARKVAPARERAAEKQAPAPIISSGALQSKSKKAPSAPAARTEQPKSAAAGSSPGRRTNGRKRVASESPDSPVPLAAAANEPGLEPKHRDRVLSGGLKIPGILLEGDAPVAAARPPLPLDRRDQVPDSAGGEASPGSTLEVQKLTLAEPERAELPAAYGTGRLFLTPRDPRCLHAHWDLTAEQQRHHLSLSAHRHFSVRVYHGSTEGRPASEVHVHPESQDWFLHVERPGQTYVAELGYYRPDKQWRSIGVLGAGHHASGCP